MQPYQPTIPRAKALSKPPLVGGFDLLYIFQIGMTRRKDRAEGERTREEEEGRRRMEEKEGKKEKGER